MAPPKSGSARSAAPAEKKGPTGLGLVYMILYNLAMAAGWAYVLYLTVNELVTHDGKWATVYGITDFPLKVFQTGAALEVLHILVGLVKSPIMTTIIQVASRVGILWGVADAFPAVRDHWSFTTMVISWSITEVVRYLYYLTNLIGLKVGLLTWLRYTLFFILYPTGAGSEFMLGYTALAYAQEHWWYILASVLSLYFPLFPYQYFHMISQRAKYIGGGGGKGKKTE